MRTVRVTELKARLSAYLRAVRRGQVVTVLDRETPIARLVPYVSDAMALTVRQPLPDSPGLHKTPLPPPLRLKVDVVQMLLDERQTDR